MKMKARTIGGFIVAIVIIMFLSLYFTMMSGYYEFNESKKSTLTQEAIERFEKDVSEGKEIVASNYLEEEVDYNNLASKAGMKISSLIEKGFNKAMGSLFKNVEKIVNEGVIIVSICGL